MREITQRMREYSILDCIPYLFSGDFITFFLKILSSFHRKVLECSPIRSCSFGRRNVPTLRNFLLFLKNRRFGGVDPPEGLEVAPDILAQNFLEITGLTLRARPSGREPGWAAPKNHRIFLENSKSGEANRMVCWRLDGLGLATSTSRRPL